MTDSGILLKAYQYMCTARAMASVYENNRGVCKYVHSVSSGHEAIQLATAFQLQPCDYVSPYYRDESLLLGLGFSPYTLMEQLLARADDIFSGGKAYYAHPNYRGPDKPTIIHQSSATGMQAIPATGIAQGIAFKEQLQKTDQPPVVLCSFGDASITEGEVSEAFQFSVLKKLPIIYLVQDNAWGISVTAEESRTMDAFRYAGGFEGMERIKIDGADFEQSYQCMRQVFEFVRKYRSPYLVHARVPLLTHHTSGVRMESYRSEADLARHRALDPLQVLKRQLFQHGIPERQLRDVEENAAAQIIIEFEKAVASAEPELHTASEHIFVPANVFGEEGEREPVDGKKILMVDAVLYALREILEDHPEAVLYGQDVGRRLGGVFRETATLAAQFGDHRVFNTAIQEAYLIGSTVGMCAAGLKPIVEIQFGDYVYPGFNQLVTEVAKSSYLSCGKFPVQALIRIPVGAYQGGGPYHSGSMESTLLSVKGLKIVYPSNAADMKGLMKAAFLDPNPVLMLEHKGLYWSKVPGTEEARTIEPSRDYIIPLGKARVVLAASTTALEQGNSCCVITYGMGVYWALAAAKKFEGQIEIIDLRTLFPLDEELLFESVRKHGKCLVLTEEAQNNSFAEALASRISQACFQWLDCAVDVLGALNVPAIPMNIRLEKEILPGAEKTEARFRALLGN
ncbi:MAG: thiamine pyrophosphate-dependent enzyme [Bacteroidota bacterium]|nr:thiamine pyrophosphate-dependent enzyme [Bacteroidota bacterium]MDP4213843.1 thiamine pyrophosphate-dependent enzyme [Bacteroidota bacterium]MDP4250097.1 thiamine pyrophosphate-dependent enzyme [Bacteroidota bacterium]